VSIGEKYQVVRMPGKYWYRFKALGTEPSLLKYFVTRLFDYKLPDEERRPWDDTKVIDPTTKRPYDWNKISHK
jgi:hypothetical protein